MELNERGNEIYRDSEADAKLGLIHCIMYMQRNTVCISGPNGGNIRLKKL